MDKDFEINEMKFFFYVIGIAIVYFIIKILNLNDDKKNYKKIKFSKNKKLDLYRSILVTPKSKMNDD